MGLLQRADLARLARACPRCRTARSPCDPGVIVGGIQRHERTIGARRLLVDHPRHQLLAGAGRAEDHDAAIGRRDLLDRLAKLRNGDRRADQLDRHRRCGASARETSRFSLEFSSARSAIRISRSALKGFSMKSKAPRLIAETAVSILP